MFTRAYLRASTEDQDASRAKGDLQAFAAEKGLTIASYYLENESGASLQRPELFRLLGDCQPGDILLIEQVDRLSRLNAADWERLKSEIASRRVKVVALDLPTSHMLAKASPDDFTARMLEAVNGMMLDVLAAVARKDYEDRRRRQAQGIVQAKEDKTKYRGRREDTDRNAGIVKMLESGMAWSNIIAATKCSRSTLARLAKRL
ncbi:MAG: recombinase family protein [Methylocystis sp.]|nr:recombinase family protein [Methylocystis sp.]MCA3584113.1 recombinase family protein [Methylocystis sp.]MCA3588344.1 recombinase family protein [Methylocystis sp.]MCA3591233.1 recombinase family protein [Methylocystis sp.]